MARAAESSRERGATAENGLADESLADLHLGFVPALEGGFACCDALCRKTDH